MEMLSDRPIDGMRWNVGVAPDMLGAIGELAVASAHMEELLHQICWKHAGLDEKSGPIVTDNLNPKRLAEDITKFVALDPTKKHIQEDFKILFKEFEEINTNRNHCLHWIWSQIDDAAGAPATSYKVSRPAYRQSGVDFREFDLAGVHEITQNCNWLTHP
jgi:hypothetical protein